MHEEKIYFIHHNFLQYVVLPHFMKCSCSHTQLEYILARQDWVACT